MQIFSTKSFTGIQATREHEQVAASQRTILSEMSMKSREFDFHYWSTNFLSSLDKEPDKTTPLIASEDTDNVAPFWDFSLFKVYFRLCKEC